MTRLYLVRHGQTQWHSNGTTSGKTDVDLDETGRDQICRVAHRLSEAEIDGIYSSPRSRCTKMAEAIAELKNIQVKTDDRLQEMDIGNWDGEVHYPLLQLGAELLKHAGVDPSQISIPSGESFDLLRERLNDWLSEVSNQFPRGSIAAVSHRGLICVLIADVTGIPMAEAFQTGIDLASITVLHYKGGSGSLEILNDTTHLKE
ncbi:MAG: histidine phosphatase family protein [Actinobacteria bacterium]|nr:histidine phosphatase family protein [Actinomycetota bacterium]